MIITAGITLTPASDMAIIAMMANTIARAESVFLFVNESFQLPLFYHTSS